MSDDEDDYQYSSGDDMSQGGEEEEIEVSLTLLHFLVIIGSGQSSYMRQERGRPFRICDTPSHGAILAVYKADERVQMLFFLNAAECSRTRVTTLHTERERRWRSLLQDGRQLSCA